MQRIAVVTGANKGIGYEIAKQLLTTCTVVVLACRNKELGEAAVKQLASPKARFMQCDISDAASIAAFADTFSTEFGALDVLVNNAAIAFKGADPTPFEGQTGPTLRTNYKGTVALTERMLPLLEKSANGHLVNIASDGGATGPGFRRAPGAVHVADADDGGTHGARRRVRRGRGRRTA